MRNFKISVECWLLVYVNQIAHIGASNTEDVKVNIWW